MHYFMFPGALHDIYKLEIGYHHVNVMRLLSEESPSARLGKNYHSITGTHSVDFRFENAKLVCLQTGKENNACTSSRTRRNRQAIMAVFTLEDEQIVWTDKSSDGLFD